MFSAKALLAKASSLLEAALRWAVAAAVGLVVVIVFADVVGRYVLAVPTYWNSEVARLLLIWITYLGAAVLVRRGALIRIDLIASGRFSKIKIWSERFSLGVTAVVLLCMGLFAWPLLVIVVGKEAPATGWPYAVFYLSLPVFSICGMFFLLDRALNGIPVELSSIPNSPTTES